LVPTAMPSSRKSRRNSSSQQPRQSKDSRHDLP
jgi:hypothetical protein